MKNSEEVGFEPTYKGCADLSVRPLRHPAGSRAGDFFGQATPEERCTEKKMEREMGFEPTTSTLARLHSTTELHPLRLVKSNAGRAVNRKLRFEFPASSRGTRPAPCNPIMLCSIFAVVNPNRILPDSFAFQRDRLAFSVYIICSTHTGWRAY